MNPIAFVKAHPIATGAIVIGGLIVVMLINGMAGGGAAEASPGPVGVQLPSGGGDAGAGLQLQAAQLAATTRAEEIASAERVALGEQATQKAIAEISAQIQGKGIDATQAINLAQIGANKEVDLSKNTLAASVQNAQTAAETERVKSTNATITAQSNAMVQMQREQNSGNIFQTIAKGIFGFLGF